MVSMRNICPKCGRPYSLMHPCTNCGYVNDEYDIMSMGELI